MSIRGGRAFRRHVAFWRRLRLNVAFLRVLLRLVLLIVALVGGVEFARALL